MPGGLEKGESRPSLAIPRVFLIVMQIVASFGKILFVGEQLKNYSTVTPHVVLSSLASNGVCPLRSVH